MTERDAFPARRDIRRRTPVAGASHGPARYHLGGRGTLDGVHRSGGFFPAGWSEQDDGVPASVGRA